MISVNGELAVTAIDQHRQLNGPRSTKITKGVQRRPHGPARVEHVVNQHHRAAIYFDR
jgi:hypothetical protein